jgi:uncharacterized protein (DUF1800 family)
MKALDPVWARYTPGTAAPWNLRRVVHLHHRAGFAGTWAELQRDVKDGPDAAIDRFLAGKVSLHSPAEFDATAARLGEAALAGGPARLKAWWFYRMLFTPDPLTEKLTLTWHNHFATSYAKVRDLLAMQRQNDLFRKHGKGRFADLLNASVREPALLEWLDATSNRKGHPNENLARELMELFTLGVGHYSEAEVKDAARALTGWVLRGGKFTEVAAYHDAGPKTILGRTGPWKGSDLIRILLAHPATAERLVWRLCDVFFGEKALTALARKSLVRACIDRDLDIGWAIQTILRSKAFFAEANLGTRVKSPVELIVGATRALELFDPAPSTVLLADWSAQMAQDLFEPPNVGGWPGGRAWISARSMITRANFATALVGGTDVGRPRRYDPAAWAKRHGLPMDANSLITFHARLILGSDPSAALTARLAKAAAPKRVALLLSAPEAQLG